MFLQKKSDLKVFTLIEVMIVLAIIGIIAGIGVPQFQNYRDSAHAKSRLMNIDLFKSACQAYLVSYDITNSSAPIIDWENSSGTKISNLSVTHPTGLQMDMQPFEISDLDSSDNTYSIFDFIKGGAASLKVGKTPFNTTPLIGQERYLNKIAWEDLHLNNVQTDFFFYVDAIAGVNYNNATGKRSN